MGRAPRDAAALSALVLDAHECHALAAVRSLGRRGVRVVAASHKPDAMSFYSRYCAERVRTPSPGEAPDAYAEWLVGHLAAARYDATLFFGEATANVVAQHRDAIQRHTGCPLPPLDVFLTADRKDRVLQLAREIGVPAPRTSALAHEDEAAELAERLEFPVIVKGVHGSGGHEVAFVSERAELVAAVRRIAGVRTDPSLPLPVVQEYVPGTGYGLTALLRSGEPLAVFMHRRLAEHDVTRGTALAHATPAAVSVDEPELRASGLALLQALRWDGVAMVEFRRSVRDGHFYLMEINPRFPGSLDLAVAAGLDLPWLYLQMATGRPVDPPPPYRLGLRYRWLVSKSVAQAFESPGTFAASVLSALRPDTRTDVSFTDPGPHYSQARIAAWWIRTHLRKAHTELAPPTR